MKFTIDKKITLFETGIILALSFVIAYYVIGYQTRALNLELDERAGVLMKNLSINAEYPVLVRDSGAIAKLGRGVMAQKDIIYCRVQDKTGRVLYEEGSKAGPVRVFSCPVLAGKFRDEEEAVMFNAPAGQEERIGKIYLAASLAGLSEKISGMREAIIKLVITVIIVASLGTYLLLRKIIGAPVSTLVEATERIAAGDLKFKLPPMARDEFGILSDSFNRMTASLRDAQEELVRKEELSILGQLAGSVGHELRNPLGVINNAVYFLKTVMEGDETAKEYLGIIKSEVDNSERIISDLLDFSHTWTPRMKAVTVNELVGLGLDKCAIPEVVAVKRDIAEGLPAVVADTFQIGQILRNLITNAVQAMPDGGELRIRARGLPAFGASAPAPDFVEISVGDTGCGISPENMAKLFQPLFTTKARGIGLGLAVSRKLAEANGGGIEVESEPGKGTTFKVTLPVRGDKI